MLTCRVISVLNKAGIKHETHLFLEGENAPAADVAAVIKKVYEETGGDMIVASRSNKVYLFQMIVQAYEENCIMGREGWLDFGGLEHEIHVSKFWSGACE